MIRHWQRIIFGVYVLMILEGALRKWVLPSAQAQIYLLKDVLLLFAYLGFMLNVRRGQPSVRGMDAIKAILVLAFLFGCMEIFNPNSPSILVGLVGVKDYFLYAPLAFILPYAFTSREQFFRLIRFYLLLAIPVAILGFVQVAAGPSSFLNTYVSYSDEAPTALIKFGRYDNVVRTAGTFSFISGYTTYLGFMAFLAIGYIMGRGWRIKNNVVALLALVLVVGAMFTTGSRGPVYTLVIMAPFILGWALHAKILSSATAIRVCLLLPIIAFAAMHTSPQAVEAFQYRAESSGDSASRVVAPLVQLNDALSNAPFFGMGIGVTHTSALTIMGSTTPWWLGGLEEEEEVARVAEELGVIGVLLLYLVRFLVVAIAVRCTSAFKDPTYRALGIVLTIQLALGLVTPIVTNPTAGLYYWGSFGLVLAMVRLEQLAYAKVQKKARPNRREFWRSAAGLTAGADRRLINSRQPSR
jgi:hypothetical protein